MNMEGFRRWRIAGATLAGLLGLMNLAHARERYLIQFQGQQSAAEEIQSLLDSSLSIVDYVPELGYYAVDVVDSAQLKALDGRAVYVEANRKWYAEETAPNDLQFQDQRSSYQRLNLMKAWDLSRGSHEVVVAVVDSGVDLNHGDLRENLWKNTKEIPENGLDDDGNGYIDDYDGWNFADGTNQPMDVDGHGTHVSGIIGAVGDNHLGVSGVNWHVRVLPIRFLDDTGRGDTLNGVKAIVYAVQRGARVINCSWGSYSERSMTSKAMEDAIRYAADHGVLVIAASGNEKVDNDGGKTHYPSSVESPGMLSIVASSGSGVKADFSNFGWFSTHLAAPGTQVLSTFTEPPYRYLSGTSMAAPMVSGVAALMLSVEPHLTLLELRNGLLNAATQRSNYEGLVATAGDLDAYTALHQLDAGEGFQVWPKHMTLKVTGNLQLSGYGRARSQDSIRWTSDHPEVATVDNFGRVSGVKIGKVKITGQDRLTGDRQYASLEVVRANPSPAKGGTSCFSADLVDPTEKVNAGVNFLMPFIFGWFYKRRLVVSRNRTVNS